jgi:membrane protein implicated in regulation of membrane protease activity
MSSANGNRVIPLLLLVSRSKLVPDFALTVHFIHLIVTSLYAKAIPTNLLWWALQAVSATLLVILGIWACRYRELQPISFGGNTAVNKTTVNGDAEVVDDHIRGGRGRMRATDGGASYEMVGMKEGDEAV